MTASRGSRIACGCVVRTTSIVTKAPGRTSAGGSLASMVSFTVPVAVSTTGLIWRIRPLKRVCSLAFKVIRTSRPSFSP